MVCIRVNVIATRCRDRPKDQLNEQCGRDDFSGRTYAIIPYTLAI